MKKIKEWSNHIVRHFWHCSSECRKDDSTSDAEALRVMKVYKKYLTIQYRHRCSNISTFYFSFHTGQVDRSSTSHLQFASVVRWEV